MDELRSSLSCVTAALLAASTAWAAGAAEVQFQAGYPVTSPRAIYKLSEVKVGDRGVGYTVFTGAEVKPFQVEVLGILTGMLGPHRDVILTRLSGPEIEFSGVIAGMSGSPVYIDGRLVGAVAYRFGSFSKEPIAGITPIESMLDVYRDPQIGPAEIAGSGAAGPKISLTALRSRELRAPTPVTARPALQGPYDPQPIETPIMLSGFSPDAVADLKARLDDRGFMLTAPGGTSPTPSPRALGRALKNELTIAGGQRAAPIAPGAPIAAVLMRGDLNAAATGTVTFLDGKQVLAFGHPFFGYGHVAFPMATAAILNTLASLAGSYKQAATGIEVGIIEHDRLTAIGGALGRVAPMVPARIAVSLDRAGAPSATILTQVEIADHDLWLPVMLGSAIASATSGRLAAEAGGTIDARAVIKVGDRALELRDTYSTTPPSRPGLLFAQDMLGLLSMIRNNGIAEAEVKGIEIEVRNRAAIELAWIDEVVPDRTVVAPGETARFRARIRPYRAEPISVTIDLPIPIDAKDEAEVVIGGAVELDHRDAAVYGDRAPEDLDDILGILAERRPGRGLYGRVYLKRPGVRSSAELYSSLPPSQRLTLTERTGLRHQVTSEALGPALRIDQPRVIIGQTSIKLRITP